MYLNNCFFRMYNYLQNVCVTFHYSATSGFWKYKSRTNTTKPPKIFNTDFDPKSTLKYVVFLPKHCTSIFQTKTSFFQVETSKNAKRWYCSDDWRLFEVILIFCFFSRTYHWIEKDDSKFNWWSLWSCCLDIKSFLLSLFIEN